MVYVGSAFDNTMYASRADTGTAKWTFPTSGAIYSSPTVANGVVYFQSDDGNVYGVDAITGQGLWLYNAGGPTQENYSSPAVADGAVYVGSKSNDGGGYLYAFDLAGSSPGDKLNPSERPDPASLKPDWSLQPSEAVTATKK